MATFGFEAVEQIHTFMVSGLQGLTTCSGIKWADINFNCNICGSHTRKKVSLVIDGLSEYIKKRKTYLYSSSSMIQTGACKNIPPSPLHGRPADLVRKVFGHLHLQVIVQSLKCFQGESSRSSSCLRVIEGKDAQDLCQECKVSQSCFILEIFFIITLFFTR